MLWSKPAGDRNDATINIIQNERAAFLLMDNRLNSAMKYLRRSRIVMRDPGRCHFLAFTEMNARKWMPSDSYALRFRDYSR